MKKFINELYEEYKPLWLNFFYIAILAILFGLIFLALKHFPKDFNYVTEYSEEELIYTAELKNGMLVDAVDCTEEDGKKLCIVQLSNFGIDSRDFEKVIVEDYTLK